eukprot:3332752-Amphidinium_carterae.1
MTHANRRQCTTVPKMPEMEKHRRADNCRIEAFLHVDTPHVLLYSILWFDIRSLMSFRTASIGSSTVCSGGFSIFREGHVRTEKDGARLSEMKPGFPFGMYLLLFPRTLSMQMPGVEM